MQAPAGPHLPATGSTLRRPMTPPEPATDEVENRPAADVDVLVVGGGMAFTFLAAAGHDVGGSMIDRDRIDDCAALLRSGKRILLPTDIVALETIRLGLRSETLMDFEPEGATSMRDEL